MERIAPREDRRKEPRIFVRKHGMLFCEHFSSMIDCEIGNESESGMHILLDPDSAEALPSQVSLLDRNTGQLVDAHIIWHEGSKAGVHFTSQRTDVDRLPRADIRRLSIIAARRQ
ncbi:PilZ domain-containing protein [uncultured Cohaesibacter sp.]|uniref:PilZ domain-containing protein n=1 Tax=uncultured Cohaesibacter sp. TaxID=1002546 RepID=UPI002AAA8BBE|nr:PilZ domain-containing protein [uncultured Cohaesibacter sp.]